MRMQLWRLWSCILLILVAPRMRRVTRGNGEHVDCRAAASRVGAQWARAYSNGPHVYSTADVRVAACTALATRAGLTRSRVAPSCGAASSRASHRRPRQPRAHARR